MGGDDVSRERGEFCYNGTWYSVCDDGLDITMEDTIKLLVCEEVDYDTNYGKVTTNICVASYYSLFNQFVVEESVSLSHYSFSGMRVVSKEEFIWWEVMLYL